MRSDLGARMIGYLRGEIEIRDRERTQGQKIKELREAESDE